MTDDTSKPIVALRVVRPYENEDQFLREESFALTKSTLVLVGASSRPEGVILRFEVVLKGGAILLRGEGRVVGYGPTPAGENGLTLKFTRLDPRSKALVDRASAAKAADSSKSVSDSGSGPRLEAPASAQPKSHPEGRGHSAPPPPPPAAPGEGPASGSKASASIAPPPDGGARTSQRPSAPPGPPGSVASPASSAPKSSAETAVPPPPPTSSTPVTERDAALERLRARLRGVDAEKLLASLRS